MSDSYTCTRKTHTPRSLWNPCVHECVDDLRSVPSRGVMSFAPGSGPIRWVCQRKQSMKFQESAVLRGELSLRVDNVSPR